MSGLIRHHAEFWWRGAWLPNFLSQKSPGRSGDRVGVWNHYTAGVVILLCTVLLCWLPARVCVHLHQQCFLAPWEEPRVQSKHWEKILSKHISVSIYVHTVLLFSSVAEYLEEAWEELFILARSFG